MYKIILLPNPPSRVRPALGYHHAHSAIKMKFGRQYSAALAQEGYPQAWVKASISYRLLKKCIKNVQKELSDVGLNLQAMEEASPRGGLAQYQLLQTLFENNGRDFIPRITFIVDSEGLPLNACLSPETRQRLEKLSEASCAHTELPSLTPRTNSEHDEETSLPFVGDKAATSQKAPGRIEIPIQNAKVFFQMLCVEVEGLGVLRKNQIDEIKQRIGNLSTTLRSVAVPPEDGKSRDTDLYAWREIFCLYGESEIFISNTEQDRSVHDSAVAQARFQRFSKIVEDSKMLKRFKRKDSQRALEQFVGINAQLINNLKFKELNMTAMTKILKKLVKRTALGTRAVRSNLIAAEPFSTRSLAKELCSQITQDLVKIVPQLDDKLCPVCMDLAWKPLLLRCGHRLCIRCALLLQRQGQKHCPCCREETIMEADSSKPAPDPSTQSLCADLR